MKHKILPLALFISTALFINSCQSDNEIYNQEGEQKQIETSSFSKNDETNFLSKVESMNQQVITDYNNGLPIHNNSYLQNLFATYDIPEGVFLDVDEVNFLIGQKQIIDEIGFQNYLSQQDYSDYFKNKINDFLNFEDISNIETTIEFQELTENEKVRLSALILIQKDLFEYSMNNNSAKGIPPEDLSEIAAIAAGMGAIFTDPGGVSIGAIMGRAFYLSMVESLEAIYMWGAFLGVSP